MILTPTETASSVCCITKGLLQSMGVRGLLLDIDNTLTTHGNPIPAPGVEEWVARMMQANIHMYLVSNNHPPRVEPFAKKLGIPCICDCKKPLPGGFRRATKAMGLSRQEVCVVGDQLYTDVLGAHLYRVKSIYVPPIEPEKKGFLRCKRILEKPFLPKCEKRSRMP